MHKCETANAIGSGFDLHYMKYLIFSFLRLGVKTKLGVEFRHSICNYKQKIRNTSYPSYYLTYQINMSKLDIDRIELLNYETEE